MNRLRLAGVRIAEPAFAFFSYLVLAIVMTWPLLVGVASAVPGDLGDSLLNMWILGWGAENVPRLLTAQIGLRDYWNANIFHPEPITLGFSEHLFGQVLQIIPVYWLTGNLILCYNLLFISSFALSGLGMYLLVRDFLGERVSAGTDGGAADATFRVVAGAFIAGLIFAFLPFRIAQVAHIQSLHAQWMPLALYGFRRFIASGHWKALAGGASALLMQNWSNGYYLIFFAPFVPLFVAHQMWTHGRMRDARLWIAFAIAALVVAAGTWPFLALYLETQRIHGFERSIAEVIRFSADVYSYLTAPEALRLWGGVMQAYPKPEGELFFGLVPWLLGAIALLPAAIGSRPRVITVVLTTLIAIQTVGFAAILFTGGFISSFAGIPIRATNPTRILTGIVIAVVLLMILSAETRARVHRLLRSPVFLCVAMLILALWLSLGPLPQSRGQALQGLGLYGVFYEHVPGFEGLRVPARYAMIAGLFLSVLAGFGAAKIARPAIVAIALAVVFLVEAAFVPLPMNLTWGDTGIAPPARVEPAADAPAVYHTLADLPDDTVVVEFPFGDPAWELRYVYYSTVHWKRIVNGYSGAFPQGYKVRVALLQRIAAEPDKAWRALRESGATHVVVHTNAFAPGDAATVTRWLDAHFAVEIARFEGDLLYDVTGVWPPK